MNKVNQTGKVTIKQAWKDFWKGFIDFKGITTRAGYWWAMLEYIIIDILFIAVIRIIMNYNLHFWLSIELAKALGLATTIFNYTFYVALLALLARRLRDAGLSNTIIFSIIGIYVVLIFTRPLFSILGNINNIFDIVLLVLCCVPTGQFNKKSNEKC